ncbi:MAG: hypothetical protein WAQ24_00520 [Candidatus Saccharimonadales bacterium]
MTSKKTLDFVRGMVPKPSTSETSGVAQDAQARKRQRAAVLIGSWVEEDDALGRNILVANNTSLEDLKKFREVSYTAYCKAVKAIRGGSYVHAASEVPISALLLFGVLQTSRRIASLEGTLTPVEDHVANAMGAGKLPMLEKLPDNFEKLSTDFGGPVAAAFRLVVADTLTTTHPHNAIVQPGTARQFQEAPFRLGQVLAGQIAVCPAMWQEPQTIHS